MGVFTRWTNELRILWPRSLVVSKAIRTAMPIPRNAALETLSIDNITAVKIAKALAASDLTQKIPRSTQSADAMPPRLGSPKRVMYRRTPPRADK